MKRHRKTKYQGNDAYHFIDILLVGDGGAGKTSIIDRLTRDTFNAVISSSIREDKARISYSIELTDFQLMTNNKSVQLRIIDSEKFHLASNREQVSQQ